MKRSVRSIFAEIKKLDTLKDLLSTAGSKLLNDFSREPLEIAGAVLLLHCSYVSMVRIVSILEWEDNEALISGKTSLGNYLTYKELIGQEDAVWFDKLADLHAGMLDELFLINREKGRSIQTEKGGTSGAIFTGSYKGPFAHLRAGERANDDFRHLSEELFHIMVEDIYYLADNSFSMIKGLKSALMALPELKSDYADI